MIRGESISFEELDTYKVGNARPNGDGATMWRVDSGRLEFIATFGVTEAAEAEISAAALAAHFGQTVIVKSEDRATKYVP